MPLKALVSQINYNLFDLEVGAQQSQFAYLQAKDLADSVEGLLRTHDVALWNGNDTSLSNPDHTPVLRRDRADRSRGQYGHQLQLAPALWTALKESLRRWWRTPPMRFVRRRSTPTRCCWT